MTSISHRACLGIIIATWWGAAACRVSGQPPAAAAVSPAPTSPAAPVAAPAVVCLSTVNDSVRLYRLHQVPRRSGEGREWRLTMTDPASKAAPVDVPLPGAAPVVGAEDARLAYRSGNGGVVVSLATSPSGASLDVYVNHELVNVDASLTPAIERLNTDGVVRLPPCRIESS